MQNARRVWRHGMVLAAAAIALAAAQQLRGQQPTGDPFTTAITRLKDGLYVIPGYDGAATGGNVAVRVTGEGVIIVDSKLPTLHDDIVAKVKSVSAQPIRYVLNTHQHGDHTGANAQFLRSADILMHRNARANMLTMKLAGLGRIVYTDQQSVFLGGAEVQMRYLGRGHTNGDSVVYFPDLRAVHTGDLVVWGKRSQGTVLTPFMDYVEGSGSGREWVATLDKLLAIDFDAAIPGHGPVLTKEQVRTFRNRMQTMNERVLAFIQRGGRKADVSRDVKLDDLGWPEAPRGLDGLFDEWSKP